MGLRVTGFAFGTFTNAWKALDALGIGDTLREQHILLQGSVATSMISGISSPLISYSNPRPNINELPHGIIRFCSKVVSIEEQGYFKLIHLADGSIVKTKVLQLSGKEIEEDPAEIKQYIVKKLGKAPKQVIDIIEKTDNESIASSPLSKENVCVAGDALHPMTPDIAQGGNAALEDGVTLARCLSRALLRNAPNEKEGYNNIKEGLDKYAKERRWRSFELISTAYIVGVIQEGKGMVSKFIRDQLWSPYLAGIVLRRAEFDCGKLYT
ncbi:hypothetical protein MKW92_002052 [Papaver armeniacum]|nr:hypothetical protein MKW92_002052 [Papaver armeniacum]